jgi:hypothetical protein
VVALQRVPSCDYSLRGPCLLATAKKARECRVELLNKQILHDGDVEVPSLVYFSVNLRRTAGFIVGLDIVALVLKLCTKGYLRQILGLSQSKISGNTLSFSPLPVVIKISQNDNDASLPNANRCI